MEGGGDRRAPDHVTVSREHAFQCMRISVTAFTSGGGVVPTGIASLGGCLVAKYSFVHISCVEAGRSEPDYPRRMELVPRAARTLTVMRGDRVGAA